VKLTDRKRGRKRKGGQYNERKEERNNKKERERERERENETAGGLLEYRALFIECKALLTIT